MCMLSRLEVITEIVGQQMVAKLMQHNLLKQFGDKLQVLHRSVFFSTVCAKAFFFLARSGVTT